MKFSSLEFGGTSILPSKVSFARDLLNLLRNSIRLKASLARSLFLQVLGVFAVLSSATAHAKMDSFVLGQEPALNIVINNRILAKVNGKAISAVDVAKKMDMLFFRQFPEYASSAQARFQFYQVNWKHVLNDLTDKELILADAEELKLPVSTGDVRQEMETLFGPNIIANLDNAGLTYEEAFAIVQGDITIRRMLFFKVNAKALKQVTPQKIRQAYEQLSKEMIRESEWQYFVVSVRDSDPAIGAETAKAIHHLLIEEAVPYVELASKVKQMLSIPESSLVNISEQYKHSDKEISPAYKEVIQTLKSGNYSDVIFQKSRKDSVVVFRIFYLEKMIPGGIVPFNEVENKIKEKLMDISIDNETEAYLKKLRQHFNVSESGLKEMIPEDFQPFALESVSKV